MPELPDVAVYIEALDARIVGHRLERILLKNPFLLRTAEPPLHVCEGRTVTRLRRIGKRIAIGLDNDVWLLIHLMIAGRLHWYMKDHRGRVRAPLLQLNFDNGVLTLTEAGTKRRASLHVVAGEAQLEEHDRGGLEVLGVAPERFRQRLSERNHTLKRALTDPHLFSGIGNAYSDEILHSARLSPFKQTSSLSDEEVQRLYDATRQTLTQWIARLQAEAGGKFPEKVTAFHEGMAAHGRYGQPCPDCGAPIQRIVYADNESNYCANCQTAGRLLADRSLSRLLRDDWPRTLEELESKRRGS
jgi:formamidopyrimidine-DNA glycosylase